MSVQEITEKSKWMQAKPGSKCLNYVFVNLLKNVNVYCLLAYVVFYVFLSVLFVKLEYPRGIGLGWGHFPTP